MDVTPNPYQQPVQAQQPTTAPQQAAGYAPPVQAAVYTSASWTGGQKAGWFFVGLFGGLVGILLASLANVGHPDRSTATKMAVIGCASVLMLGFLLTMFAGCSLAAIAASVPAYY